MSSTPLVAIVDDDAAIRAGLSSLLRSAGYAVELFGSGEAFLERQGVEPVRVVIADVQMPGMSGLELQAGCRERRPGLPFLIMTAFPEPALRRQALSGGAVCFLSKPFEAEELLECLRKALRR